MQALSDDLQARIEEDPAVALLCDLIRCRSVTPDDAGCQEILTARLNALGFTCETLTFGEVDNFWARRGDDGPYKQMFRFSFGAVKPEDFDESIGIIRECLQP